MVKMKDSGLPWIGKIPEEWEVASNKFVMEKVKEIIPKYVGEPILSLSMKGVHERNLDDGGKMPATFDDYQAVKHGNLLLCLFDIDVTPRCVGFIRDDGITSPAYSQYKVDHNNITKYYYYYYLMIDNNKVLVHLTKSLRNTINSDQFDNIKTVIPPKLAQQQIANFLDRKTAEIEGLIDKINTEIDTLKQYQRSVITRAVTKGLDPSVPMKDSGIEWIGEIPETWELVAAKRCIILENGSEPKTDSGDTPVYGSGSQSFRTCQEFKLGPTVLLGRKGTIDRPQWIEGKFWNIDTALNVRSKGINLKYYYYCSICFDYEWYVTQTAKPSMTQTDYYNMQIPLPVKAEQQQIVDYLDQKVAQIQKLIKSKQQQIDQLLEYKNSLIFEYVTGKKRVPQMEGRN